MLNDLRKIIPFFKLIRYTNLLIIILTQILTYYFITDWYLVYSLNSKGILLLISGSVLIAAAGNMINDLFDIETDKINKPEKILIGNVFNKNFVLISYIIFNLIALIIGIMISKQIFIIYIFSILMLLLYSAYYKKHFLIGNLIVSFLVALSIFIVWIFCPFGNPEWLFFYTSFAFITNMIREIIKDIEDIKGDKELNCQTLPIVAGIRSTKIIVTSFLVILVLMLLYLLLSLNLFIAVNSFITVLYLNILIIPIALILYRLYKAKEKEQFHEISNYLKLIMLAGILSILTLKFHYPL